MIRKKIYALVLTLCLTLTAAWAQKTFVYPDMPASLTTVEQRLDYLALHYWDKFDFNDTTQLNNPDIVEQGFVNYVDILPRFSERSAQQSVAAFTGKAFGNAPSKAKFKELIEHYLDDPESPMRDDRTYLLFLRQMHESPDFDWVEKERIAFKIRTTDKNLPGDVASDLQFTGKDGRKHRISDYKQQVSILYFYDPDCDNCKRISAWLAQQTIPPSIAFVEIRVEDDTDDKYSIRATPSIYLLDKGNVVLLKDCSPELLMQAVEQISKQQQ